MSGDGPGVTVGQQSHESERLAGHRMEESKDNVGPAGTSAAVIAPDHGDLLSGIVTASLLPSKSHGIPSFGQL